MSEIPLYTRIAAFAAPLAHCLGLVVWGVEVALGPRSLVRVYVEKQDGEQVDIGACAELSRMLGLGLDVEDMLEGAYTLEVSSPGLERVFFTEAQLLGALLQVVEVQLKTPNPSHPGRRRFRGTLVGYDQGVFALQPQSQSKQQEALLHFAFNTVKKAHLVYMFPEKTLPGKPMASKGSKKKQPDENTATTV